jgi:hypothetical protein
MTSLSLGNDVVLIAEAYLKILDLAINYSQRQTSKTIQKQRKKFSCFYTQGMYHKTFYSRH